VLKPESWAQIFEPVRLNSGKTYPYGFGWELATIADQKTERHRGLWLGFTNYISRYVSDDLTIIVLTNLIQPDLERILLFVDGISAIINPVLAPRAPQAIADREPEVTARLKGILVAAQEGRLVREDFPFGEISRFFQIAAGIYKDLLKGLGAPQHMDLVAREELDDDRIYEYEVSFERKAFRVRLGLAPDQRISDFQIHAKEFL
jgi:hypothetical protein